MRNPGPPPRNYLSPLHSRSSGAILHIAEGAFRSTLIHGFTCVHSISGNTIEALEEGSIASIEGMAAKFWEAATSMPSGTGMA
jgi:hypothetical protein